MSKPVGAGPKEGQRIEFLSDGLTDKGPATGEIVGTKITVDGLYVTVDFGGSQEMFSWDDLDNAGADIRGDLWMVKSHVKGYSKKDGTYVSPHHRDGKPGHVAQAHPKSDHNGHAVYIHRPSHASSHTTWHNPDAVATFLPDGDVPLSINGVAIKPWRDYPRTEEGWEYADGINEDLNEPDFHIKPGKVAAAGVVIEESDGRAWIIHPTNAFGGYESSWPKGTVEDGMSLQASALKEAFEESGLKVEITGFIGDFERTTSVCRMYRAKRISGDPTSAGWESQAISLVPKGLLYDQLNMSTDHGIAEAVGAGPAPKPKKIDWQLKKDK